MEDDPRKYVPEWPGGRFAVRWVSAVVIALVAMGGMVLARELRIRSQTEDRVQALQRGPRVLIKPLRRAAAKRALRVPADVHGYVETPIYAKIPGYLKTMLVDKGDRVKKGQLLALLLSPETDQQVANAEADLRIKDLTNRRYQDMVKFDAASQQQADVTRAEWLQAQATLRQLKAMQGYEGIRADFDGLITARNVDPGTLITQTTTSTGSAPMAIVSMATMSPLRVYAYLPQRDAPLVKNGDAAAVTVYEYPGRKFEGTVTRHPEALSRSTRTMLVEVDLPNRDLALYPGMYAMMELQVAGAAGAPMVPDDALIFRDAKTWVPIVQGNRLRVIEVKLGYDDGQYSVVAEGLKGDEMVAMNVGQTARDGEVVEPVAAPPDKSG